MTDLHRFAGVFAAMVTPFADDGASLSEERLRSYCDFLIARGVSGLFAFGTTGRVAPARRAGAGPRGTGARPAGAAGRVPVIVHAGAHATDLAARLAARGAGGRG